MKNTSKKPGIGKKVLGALKKLIHKKWFKVILVLLIIILVGKVVVARFMPGKNVDDMMTTQTAMSERRDIQTELSSSGTVLPLNKYEVKSLVEGEVIAADFEEGDEVKEGDILYRIGSKALDSKVKTAKNSVSRAEKRYEQAKKSYDKAVEKYGDSTDKLDTLNVKTKAGGIVTELNVKAGDSVQVGMQVAKIYDNSFMLLTVPFNSSEVRASWVGKSAQVEIDETGETLKGIVTKVSKIKKVLSGNRVVQEVTIKVKNPGGITTETTAIATVDQKACNNEGLFKVLEEKIITSEISGEVRSLKVEEGDRVKEGDTLIICNSDAVKEQIDAVLTSVDSAEAAVEDAKTAIDDAKLLLQEQLDAETNYTVNAPISGQIVRKDILIGDTIKSTNTSNVLCVIYDLSALTFDMNIDELDIKSVEVGQDVEIMADALPGTKIKGVVTSISLESKTNNGVTQYPVTVRISDIGGLLPGMNVTGKIILTKVENVVAVPVGALMRGDVVYVKDESVTEAKGDVPVGFKEVKVQVGISDDNFIEIISGLDENIEVYNVPQMEDELMMDMQMMEGDMQSGSTSEY